MTPNGLFAYVANQNANNVSVINTATNAVIATVGTTSHPNAVAITPNGLFAYVAGSSSVSVISTATNAVSPPSPWARTPKA